MDDSERITIPQFLEKVENDFIRNISSLSSEYAQHQATALNIPLKVVSVLWKDVIHKNIQKYREANIQLLLSITHPTVSAFLFAKAMYNSDPVNWDEVKEQLISSLNLNDTRIDNTLFKDWDSLSAQAQTQLVGRVSFDIPVNLLGSVITTLIEGIKLAVQTVPSRCGLNETFKLV